MIYLVSILIVSLSFYLRKSNITFISLFLLVWIFLGWSTGNADFTNYFDSYLRNSNLVGFSGSNEIGYQLIIKISSKVLGLEYSQFLILSSIICLILISSTILKFSKSPSAVLALYFIYPLIIDGTQMRSFFTMSILTFSIRYLVERNRLNLFKYILLITLATTIHYSAFFFFIFVLVYLFDHYKLRNLTMFGVIAGLIIGVNIFKIVELFIPIQRINRYLLQL